MNIEFSQALISKLKNAEKIVVFTGAGISSESGIPTFRGKDGIWNKLKPEELANFDAFLRNPDMVWEWYQYRRKIINESKPNPAHSAIVELEKFYDVKVVTQNIDNLHCRAGSKTIYELHGNIERNFCIDCNTFYTSKDFEFAGKVPRCIKCGGLVRPDIVWFGEMLPQHIFTNAETAAEECDICFIIGTSAIVYPAANIPIYAKRMGAYLIEVNITQTEITSYCDTSLIGKAGEIMTQIVNKIKEIHQSNDE
ncbi:MAG: NAD-dependent deacylase [Ignavibacteria bacterium]|jgi:NAD-dependent deacetylase